MNDRKSADPGYPDVDRVGSHLVIARREWVPGPHPDPYLREDGQTEYVESYFRCIRCEAERLRKRDFPDECDAETTDRGGDDAAVTTDPEPDGEPATTDRGTDRASETADRADDASETIDRERDEVAETGAR